MLKRSRIDIAAETYDSLVNAARTTSPGDVSFILSVIYRRWRLVGSCILGGLLLGLAAFVVLPRSYAATSQIVIDFRRLAVVAPNEATFNYRMGDAAVQTQVAIVSSDSVLRRVVDKLDLTKDPDFVTPPGVIKRTLIWLGLVEDPAAIPNALRDEAVTALRKTVKAEREGISYMLTVSASSRDAEKAAALANAVAEAYRDDQMASRSGIARQAYDWYKERLADLQNLAANALRTAADFRAQNQIVFASGRYVEEQQIENYSIRLLGAQNRRVIAEARLKRILAILAQEGRGDAALGSGGVAEELNNPVIVSLLTRYNEIGRRFAETMLRYGPEHEAVKKITNERAEMQRAMDAELRRVAESLRSEAEITRSEEENLKIMLVELGEKVTKAQKARVELDLLDAAASSYTKLRESFIQEYSAATQQETYPVNETNIQTRAAVPLQPSAPNLRRSLVGGSAAGLLLGLCFAFGLQVFDRRMRTRQQAELITGSPCLGYVPELPNPLEPAPIAQKLLDTILLNVAGEAKSRGRAIGILGALPEHGGSHLSLALAAHAAKSGRKTLLVDLNQLTRAITTTVTHHLSRRADASNGNPSMPQSLTASGLLQHPDRPGLFILPISAIPTRGSGRDTRLNLSGMPSVLDEACGLFDLVIVDLPPLAPVTSARQAAGLVDSVVLVVGWHTLDAQDLSDFLAADETVDERLIGTVYSQVDLEKVSLTEDAALVRTVAGRNVRGTNP